jgi:hypothetical protein
VFRAKKEHHMKSSCTVVLALAGAASIAGLPHPAAPPADGAPAVVEWVGAHSRVTQPRFERVRTREQWEDLWHLHTGEGRRFKDTPYAYPPRIDFGRFEIIAYFRGPSKNCDGEELVSSDRLDDATRLRFDSITYQTMAAPGEKDDGVDCEPFGIWLIDRTTGPIVIEENVQGIIGQPPKWKEQHRFSAPK